MPPTKPPYPLEFRREAVQLAQNPDRSIAQVARDLGVSNQTLRNWIKQADVVSRTGSDAPGETLSVRHLLVTMGRGSLGPWTTSGSRAGINSVGMLVGMGWG